MATRRTTFDKLQRERARMAKASAKRDRRLEKAQEEQPVSDQPGPHDGARAADLLAMIEEVHRQREAGQISAEELEERKAELLAALPID
ncbi:MAG TPA: hypothetical protein VM263_12055 [Acidimicrobiales bacterium]|jgi:uncharacterized membrane protein YqiK|nr:hypothetical protein [Acidimicrobiales bacterium]